MMPTIILYVPSSHLQSDIQDQSQFHNFFLKPPILSSLASFLVHDTANRRELPQAPITTLTHLFTSVPTLSTFSLVTKNKVQVLLWSAACALVPRFINSPTSCSINVFFYGSLLVPYKHSSHSIFKENPSPDLRAPSSYTASSFFVQQNSSEKLASHYISFVLCFLGPILYMIRMLMQANKTALWKVSSSL